MVFSMVIEPPWADAYIHLTWAPLIRSLHPPLCLCVVLLLALVIHSPIGLSCPAPFVANPTYGVCGATEDHDVLVILEEHLRGTLIVVVGQRVNLASRVCTTIPACPPIGSIEPVFEELAVVCREFTDLLMEGFLVLRETILGVIPIPG